MLLIKTIEEIEKKLHLQNSTFADYQNFIETAQTQFLKPALGQALFDDLLLKYEAQTINHETDQLLLARVQKVLVLFASALGVLYFSAIRSTNGIAIPYSKDSRPISDERLDKIEANDYWQAYQALEELYIFLEKHEIRYDKWRTSEAYTIFKENFFATAQEFNVFIPIAESRQCFMAFRQSLARVQTNQIKNILGKALFDELFSQYKQKSLSDRNADLLPLVRSFLANEATAHALQAQRIRLLPSGLFVNALQKTGFDQAENLYQTTLTRYQDDARADARILINYLNDNARLYPKFEDSPHHTKSKEPSKPIKNVFGMF